MKLPESPLRRRITIVVSIVVFGLVVAAGRPTFHLLSTAIADRFADRYDPAELPSSMVDDASRMNATRIHDVVDVPTDQKQAERVLADVLDRARRDKLRIAISGARHTMGGQSQLPGAILVNMLPLSGLELVDGKFLRAGAGARWHDVIRFLDERGLSVAVMQSNNDFSIGGSLGANCHGWQPRRAPIVSSVRAMRVMTADGQLHRASREEDAELFSLVIGGYGLFGIVLEVDLEVVPNERYRPERWIVPLKDYVAKWDAEVAKRDDVGMAFGRLSVAPESFLNETMLTVFRRAPGDVPKLGDVPLESMRRTVFRGSVASDYGKDFRWRTEKALSEQLAGKFFSRNQLLDESAAVYSDRSRATTDILHEYFVPPENLLGFVDDLGRIVKKHRADLLNVTLREVRTDDTSVLRYADRDLISLVLLFNQARDDEADRKAQAMTRELVAAALARGGRHYLPYRLHADREQLRLAYPSFDRFVEAKRRWDPDELFQNRFWTTYVPRR